MSFRGNDNAEDPGALKEMMQRCHDASKLAKVAAMQALGGIDAWFAEEDVSVCWNEEEGVVLTIDASDMVVVCTAENIVAEFGRALSRIGVDVVHLISVDHAAVPKVQVVQ